LRVSRSPDLGRHRKFPPLALVGAAHVCNILVARLQPTAPPRYWKCPGDHEMKLGTFKQSVGLLVAIPADSPAAIVLWARPHDDSSAGAHTHIVAPMNTSNVCPELFCGPQTPLDGSGDEVDHIEPKRVRRPPGAFLAASPMVGSSDEPGVMHGYGAGEVEGLESEEVIRQRETNK